MCISTVLDLYFLWDWIGRFSRGSNHTYQYNMYVCMYMNVCVHTHPGNVCLVCHVCAHIHSLTHVNCDVMCDILLCVRHV